MATITGMYGAAGSSWRERALSVLRIATSFMFMLHGAAKVLHIPHQSQYDNLQMFSLIWFAGLLELVGGFLCLIGGYTRQVAFVLSGEMAFAYWMAHAPRNPLPLLNQGDASVLYCFVFLYLVFAGAGPWSVDAMRRRR